jgi:hypothetical protein
MEDIYNRIRHRHAEYAFPESLRLVSLEETHELFENAGFRKTRIYGIHEIVFADPSKYISWVDAPTALWKINLPSEFPQDLAASLRKEIKEEMTRTKTAKGFKATHYNIFAYAQKT